MSHPALPGRSRPVGTRHPGVGGPTYGRCLGATASVTAISTIPTALALRTDRDPMILRQFLYLDRPLVRDFLAQLEHGVVDESTERQSGGRRRGGGVAATAGPVSVRAEGQKDSASETESVVRQLAASEFDRLYAYLSGEDLVIIDEISETQVLDQIHRKLILEVDGRIQLSGIAKVFDVMRTMVSAAPLMGSLGAEVRPDEINAIASILALESGPKAIPLILTVPGEAGVTVALECSEEHALADRWDGDVSVLLKVQRVLKPGERQAVGDPFGGLMNLMPEGDRQQMLNALESKDLAQLGVGASEISYPGFRATPVAIYR